MTSSSLPQIEAQTSTQSQSTKIQETEPIQEKNLEFKFHIIGTLVQTPQDSSLFPNEKDQTVNNDSVLEINSKYVVRVSIQSLAPFPIVIQSLFPFTENQASLLTLLPSTVDMTPVGPNEIIDHLENTKFSLHNSQSKDLDFNKSPPYIVLLGPRDVFSFPFYLVPKTSGQGLILGHLKCRYRKVDPALYFKTFNLCEETGNQSNLETITNSTSEDPPASKLGEIQQETISLPKLSVVYPPFSFEYKTKSSGVVGQILKTSFKITNNTRSCSKCRISMNELNQFVFAGLREHSFWVLPGSHKVIHLHFIGLVPGYCQYPTFNIEIERPPQADSFKKTFVQLLTHPAQLDRFVYLTPFNGPTFLPLLFNPPDEESG